ncbi:uncharacterized protein LOC126569313 [Anopheles aquasalis]|uniref:uncharacterized protein LOC126569313 n=1 Tax=Anopheles aquasalis TaxID=42839 RepID=UPI00215A5BD3|nr:uncharacterized protein LOC126569313 [Anopheles aquasalis]
MTLCMRCNKLTLELEVANKTISILNEAYDELNEKYVSLLEMTKHDNRIKERIETIETDQEELIQNDPQQCTLMPVDSLEDLKRLEASASSEEFVRVIRSEFAQKHKDLPRENGDSISYQVIDLFFTRAFLTLCSWTGTMKHGPGEESRHSKIPMVSFTNTIQLFYQIVNDVDPSYTLEKTENFIKKCCRHALQRLKHKRMRKSVAKPRGKKNTNNLVIQRRQRGKAAAINSIQQPSEEPQNNVLLQQCEISQNNLIQPQIVASENNMIHIRFAVLP